MNWRHRQALYHMSTLSEKEKVGANMLIVFVAGLGGFSDNLSDYIEERRKGFRQDIMTTKERYQGRWEHETTAIWNVLTKNVQSGFSNSFVCIFVHYHEYCNMNQL